MVSVVLSLKNEGWVANIKQRLLHYDYSMNMYVVLDILFVFIRCHFEVDICEAIAFGIEVAGLEDAVLPDHVYRDQILNPAGNLKLPLPLLLESAECL